MALYLIRHTTPDIAPGICYGQTDLDVGPAFTSEAEKITTQLHQLGVADGTSVFSSPLIRCRKLAEQISPVEIMLDPRLMELNFGDWEMRHWNDLNADKLKRWGDDFVNQTCPNGESYQQLHNRTALFLSDLSKHGIDEALIVTHGGVMRSLLCHLRHTHLIDSFNYELKYGEIICEHLTT